MIKKFFNTRFSIMALTVLILSIGVLVVGIKEIINENKKPIDFATMKESQLEDGAIVEGDLKYNLGNYEQIEHTRNGSTESVDYCYVIPVGEKGYAGILSNDETTTADLDKQTTETFKMLNGETDSTQTVIHFKGMVDEMTDEDYGYFSDYLKDIGFTDSEIDELGCKYCIHIRSFGSGKILIIVGVVALVIAVILILICLGDAKKLAQRATGNQTYSLARSENSINPPYDPYSAGSSAEDSTDSALPTPEDFNKRY